MWIKNIKWQEHNRVAFSRLCSRLLTFTKKIGNSRRHPLISPLQILMFETGYHQLIKKMTSQPFLNINSVDGAANTWIVFLLNSIICLFDFFKVFFLVALACSILLLKMMLFNIKLNFFQGTYHLSKYYTWRKKCKLYKLHTDGELVWLWRQDPCTSLGLIGV